MNKHYSLLLKLICATGLFFSVQSAQAQYCSTGLYSYGCTSNDYVNAVSTTGGTTNISNLTSGCNGGSVGYTNFTTFGTLGIQAGQTFNITVVNNPSWSEWYGIYVDFNCDGDFLDPLETVFLSTSAVATNATVGGGPIAVLVPTTATAGNTRVRVRCVYGSAPATACSYQNGGEVEDYPMIITPACNGPVYTAQPSNKNFCQNGTASFSATATNATTYQWQVNSGSGFTNITNNAIYSGATTNTLNLTNIPAVYNNYQYRLKSVSSCGTPTNSNSASLLFYTPITIPTQTSDVLVCADAATSMDITAAGPVASYKWQMGTLTNGYVDVPAQFPFSGTNTQKLDIASAGDTLNGLSFRCIVYGPCLPDTSADIPMNVIKGPFIEKDPLNDTVAPYNNAHFEITPNGTQYVLYWQASADNGTSFVNINDNSLYFGSNKSTLYLNSVNPGQSGMQFRCILKSTNPACGLLRDTSASASLYVGHTSSVSDLNKSNIEITLYPNPVNGNTLFVNAAKLPVAEVRVQIIDKLGRVVYSSKAHLANDKVINVPVQGLAAGTYSIQLSDKDDILLTTAGFSKQ